MDMNCLGSPPSLPVFEKPYPAAVAELLTELWSWGLLGEGAKDPATVLPFVFAYALGA